jgi:hypothetical protein
MKQSAECCPDVQSLLFGDIFQKPVSLEMGPEPQSGNAGLLLYGALDRGTKLTERAAHSVREWRCAGKVQHQILELVRQRVYGLLAGYADGNDAAKLRHEPTFRLLLERALDDDKDALASQPTLSRFENGLARGSLMRWGWTLVRWVLEQRRRRGGKVRRVTLDLDPTDDAAHGQQQFSFFNGHYDHRCFLPLLAFATFHGKHNQEEPERHLLAGLLRPGNANAMLGAVSLLERLVRAVRESFPQAKVRVRLDGAYATPEMLEYLEEEHLEYVINLGKNSVLEAKAETYMLEARKRAVLSGQTERVFGEFEYTAGSWQGRARRVVLKAEVTVDPAAPGKGLRDNPRFVVTNLRSSPEHVYREVYCPRGSAEQGIEELKNGLYLGRTSCTDFLANQARVLLAVTAYILAQELRARAQGTAAERWQVGSLRTRLVKIAALVRESTRRWVFRVSRRAPDAVLLWMLARRLGAVPSG